MCTQQRTVWSAWKGETVLGARRGHLLWAALLHVVSLCDLPAGQHSSLLAALQPCAAWAPCAPCIAVVVLES